MQDLVGQFVGSTAEKTKNLVKLYSGGVVFIDEAYTLVKSEAGSENDFGKEAIDVLLRVLNGDDPDIQARNASIFVVTDSPICIGSSFHLWSDTRASNIHCHCLSLIHI